MEVQATSFKWRNSSAHFKITFCTGAPWFYWFHYSLDSVGISGATQSSTYNENTQQPTMAVDGNPATFSHTKCDTANPWLQVKKDALTSENPFSGRNIYLLSSIHGIVQLVNNTKFGVDSCYSQISLDGVYNIWGVKVINRILSSISLWKRYIHGNCAAYTYIRKHSHSDPFSPLLFSGP